MLALIPSLVKRVHMQRMSVDADVDDADDADDVDDDKFCDTYMILTISFNYMSSNHIGGAIRQEPFVSSTKRIARPRTLYLWPSATSTSWRASNHHGNMPSLRS